MNDASNNADNAYSPNGSRDGDEMWREDDGWVDEDDELTDTVDDFDEETDGRGADASDAALTSYLEENEEKLEAELGDFVSYDCTRWSGESRQLLQSLFTTNDIPQVWHGTVVSVPRSLESKADEFVDAAVGAARASLRSDVPQVVYEVGDWPAAALNELTEAITETQIPYAWNVDGDLVIYAEDEDIVDDLLEELPEIEDFDTVGSDDGVAVHQVLDRVFMATDRLAKNATDSQGTIEFVEHGKTLVSLAVPFGFTEDSWSSITDPVGELLELFDSNSKSSDGEIKDAAKLVRNRVQGFI